MPMAGAGFFGSQLGMMAPLATLVMHWIYGAVLGGVYGAGPAHKAFSSSPPAKPTLADIRRG